MVATTHNIHADSTDAVLLDAWVHDQHEAAFEYLVERYAPMLQQVCLRQWSGDTARADEAVQTVFIILARKADQIRSASSIGAWLHRTAINTIKMQHRLDARHGKKHQQVLNETVDVVAHEDGAPDLEPLMDAAVNSLSNKNRESVILFYFQEHSIKQIAERLHISEAAVKRRLHESRNRLRTWFTRAGYSASLLLVTACLETIQASSHIALTPQDIAGYFPPSASLVAPQTEILVRKVIRDMTISKIHVMSRALALLFICLVVGLAAADAIENDTGVKPDQDERAVDREAPPEDLHWDDLQDQKTKGLLHPQSLTKISHDLLRKLNQDVTLDFQDVALADVLAFLSAQTHVVFEMSDELKRANPPITMTLTGVKLLNAIKFVGVLSDTIFVLDKDRVRFDVKRTLNNILNKPVTLQKDLTLTDLVMHVRAQTGVTITLPPSVATNKIYEFMFKGAPLIDVLRYVERQVPQLKRKVVNIHVQYELETESDRLLREGLQQKMTVKFVDNTLQEFVEFLRRNSGLNMVIDPKLVQHAQDKVISIEVAHVTLAELFDRVLGPQLEARYVIRDGGIYITETVDAVKAIESVEEF